MPLFTKGEMNRHIEQSGKTFGSCSKIHSVPTSLRKAKTFLEDEYLKEIQAASDDHCFYFKSLCYHSFKKSEPPHKLHTALSIVTGEVLHASCSCIAGKTGFCNHVLGLLIKLCNFSTYECKDIRQLNKDGDMTPKVACTSALQMWHRTGRGDKIRAQPVMEVVVKKSKLDMAHSSEGLKCLLYESRKKCKSQISAETRLKEELSKINPKMGLCEVANSKSVNSVDTRFGKSPLGSYASYQLTFTESNFKVYCNIDAVPRLSCDENSIVNMPDSYPRFSLKDTTDYIPITDGLDDAQKALLDYIMVDEDKLNSIEMGTRDQAASEEWKNERKYRLTASNFKTICKRQRNHITLVNNLLNPKQVSSKYTEHGKKYESVALQHYEKYMFSIRRKVVVLQSGLVVCKEMPFLGASPDAKVIDKSCTKPFGIAEVKCPLTKFHVTPLDACADQGFCADRVDDMPKLKRDHPYYYQIQGQLAVTRASWCDFIIYTSAGMSIERIEFAHEFWDTLSNKLKSYYFEHYIGPASVKFSSIRQD